jgi:YD repeat-containing protein
MKNDPIVAEVRRERQKYSARFGHDIKAMCDDLDRKTEQARRDGRRVSSPPPRPAHPGRLPAKRAG